MRINTQHRNKKAQITLFIVIGILLLFATAIIFYVKNRVVEYQFSAETNPVLEKVPMEFDPLQDYVTQCLKDTAKQGLKHIALQGGYYRPEKYGITVNPQDPTSSNAMSYFANQGIIPYWSYMASDNTCKGSACRFDSKKPLLLQKDNPEGASIEGELAYYIEDNLPLCLNSFRSFQALGFTVRETGERKVRVRVTDSDVLVTLEMPLEAKKDAATTTMKTFFTRLDVNLNRMYELASLLTQAQSESNVMEKYIINALSGHSGVGTPLPPVRGDVTIFPSESSQWQKSEVEKLLVTDVLPRYTPFMEVPGTVNFHSLREDPYADGIYGIARIPVESQLGYDFFDYKVTFDYMPYWPIYFNLHGEGAEGPLVMPEQVIPDLSLIPIDVKRYQYYYDFSYPVLVRLQDLSAFDGEGLEFWFALEANVRNSNPVILEDSPLAGISGTSTQLCEDDVGVVDYTIVVKDGSTNLPLKDAQVSYGSYTETCPLGYTAIYRNVSSDLNNQALLKKKLPVCVGEGCLLLVQKYGYSSYTEQMSVMLDDSSHSHEKTVLLYPKKAINITVKKIPLVRNTNPDTKKLQPWKLSLTTKQRLSQNEQAVIQLTRIKKTPTEQDFSQTAFISGDAMQQIELIPGEYDVNIQLFTALTDEDGNPIVVSERICVQPDDSIIGMVASIFGGSSCKEWQDVNLTLPVPAPIGTTYLTQESQPFKVGQELYSSNTLELYAFALPGEDYISLSLTDYQESTKVLEYSQRYVNSIKPLFR